MGAEISKLAVTLTANSGAFTSGLKGGEAALNSLGATASRVSGVFSGLGGLLGGIGIGFSLLRGFEKAGEAEANVATLGAVVRATGQSAGFSATSGGVVAIIGLALIAPRAGALFRYDNREREPELTQPTGRVP